MGFWTRIRREYGMKGFSRRGMGMELSELIEDEEGRRRGYTRK